MDTSKWMMYGGAAAILGVLASGWGYIRGILSNIKNIVLRDVRIDNDAFAAICLYVRTYCKHYSMGHGNYTLFNKTIYEVDKRPFHKRVMATYPLEKGVFFFYKRSPVYYNNDVLHFIRGTFKIEEFLAAAVEHYNKLAPLYCVKDRNTDEAMAVSVDGSETGGDITDGYWVKKLQEDERESEIYRFAINYMHGSVGQRNGFDYSAMEHMASKKDEGGSPFADKMNNKFGKKASSGFRTSRVDTFLYKFLNVENPKLLMYQPPSRNKAKLSYYYSKDLAKVRHDMMRFSQSFDWYEEVGVAWKRGYLLHGVPGTGKTAFVRTIAKELGWPIYSFDLKTFTNKELREAFIDKVKEDLPAITLFEDIDTVFDGRKSINEALSFDCFLNCVDGIEEYNGMITILTTNRPEVLDEALCIVDKDGKFKRTRPGRIDRVVKFDILDRSGKLFMANKLMNGLMTEEQIEKLVSEGEGETQAQFQDRCTILAQKLYWGDDDDDN